jgi:hypothetical protein
MPGQRQLDLIALESFGFMDLAVWLGGHIRCLQSDFHGKGDNTEDRLSYPDKGLRFHSRCEYGLNVLVKPSR